jgi:hypothetical protein
MAKSTSISGQLIECFFRSWVKLFGKAVSKDEEAWLDGPTREGPH